MTRHDAQHRLETLPNETLSKDLSLLSGSHNLAAEGDLHMRLPQDGAHYSHRIRSGRYTERRLRTAKRLTMANDLAAATTAVLKAGRDLEDTIGPVQEAIADRDVADDDLDAAAQHARLTLASRALGADKKAPYTSIFHEGIGYYTAARLEDEVARYGELKSRLAEHLPATDDVRTSTIAAIDAGIAAFTAAMNAVSAARTQESLAKTHLEVEEEAWERQMTKVYGILLAELGRPAAEAFFPKTRSSKSKNDDGRG
jgi:hypothetical protein